MQSRKFVSRAYWNNYIDSIIDSIKEDKETIIDMLMYGIVQNAEITMLLTTDTVPSYQINVNKIAKKSPFGKLIAPGVMSFMSVWAKYLEVDYFGEELLAGKSTKIEWLKPVFAEDVLTGKATITKLFKRNAKNGLVEITIEAYNQNGDLVLTDVTDAIVKCKTEQ